MESIFEESKDYEIDNELKRFKPWTSIFLVFWANNNISGVYWKWINGCFIKGMQNFWNLHSQWWKGFRTYWRDRRKQHINHKSNNYLCSLKSEFA